MERKGILQWKCMKNEKTATFHQVLFSHRAFAGVTDLKIFSFLD